MEVYNCIMQNPHELSAPPIEQPILRVHAFAADLAYGALKQLWGSELLNQFAGTGFGEFLRQKWNNNYPSYDLLVSFGYLRREFRYSENRYILTQKAFDLLDKVPAGIKVFISYGRAKSSALALALHYRLISLGVKSFLDKELDLGEEWHSKLKSRIIDCDYFIPILAPGALDSKYVRKEIEWAFDAKRSCIPVWHTGFSIKKDIDGRSDFENQYKEYLKAKNAYIIDGSEKAAIYDNAINSIINQLGFS